MSDKLFSLKMRNINVFAIAKTNAEVKAATKNLILTVDPWFCIKRGIEIKVKVANKVKLTTEECTPLLRIRLLKVTEIPLINAAESAHQNHIR